jgi:nucleotide-binding universal stress UspA family protein
MVTAETKTKTNISFKNILLATDFSQASDNALAYAAAIARLHHGKLFLAHAIPPEVPTSVPLDPLPWSLDRDLQEAEINMRRFARKKFLEHIAYEGVIERGPTSEVILDLIARNRVDLLVLGTHGRGGLKKLLLGSVAEELFRLAACPVLTVGPGAFVPATAEPVIRRVLFVTDFSPASLNALPYAISIARESNAQIFLLHILSVVPLAEEASFWPVSSSVIDWVEQSRLSTLEQLRKLIPAEENLPRNPDSLVTLGFVPEEIVKTAGQINADLIVMGVNESSAARAAAHLYWSTAHYVVCEATCPVLTIKG